MSALLVLLLFSTNNKMYLDICAKCSNNRFHKICVLDELFCDSMISDRIRQDIFHKCARIEIEDKNKRAGKKLPGSRNVGI